MKVARIAQEFKVFKEFIGRDTLKIFNFSILLGILWFLSETGFVFILQSFLFSLGLLNAVSTYIPHWYPRDIESNILILLAYGFIKSFVLGLKQYFSGKVSQTFIAFKRKQIIQYALENAGTESTDRVYVLFTERVNQASYLLDVLFSFVNSSISTFLFLTFALTIAPKELSLGIILLILFLLPFKFLSKKINEKGSLVNQEINSLSEIILNGMKNNFLLKIYQMVDREVDEGKRRLDNYRTHFLGFLKVNAAKNVVPGFIGILVIAIVTYFSVMYFGTEKTKLLAFYYIFMRAAQGASDANNFMSYFRLNMPAIRDLQSWQTQNSRRPPQVLNIRPTRKIDRSRLDINAKDISFGYSENDPIISNLNLTASKGDFVVIRGKSGTGKSTLLSILLGIIKPDQGQVLYNQDPVAEVAGEWFKSLAYVGPEPFMVRGTVRQNLLYGHYAPETVNDNMLWETLDKLEMKDLIQNLPTGLDFILNEKAQLSTGQRQRISIGRALLRKPVLLIMDEATANLDVKTEEKIISLLETLKAEMTIISVTHKSAFDPLSTKLIVMENENG